MPRHRMRLFAVVGVALAALAVGWGCNGGPGTPAPGTPEPAPDPDLLGPDLFQDVTPTSGVNFAYRNGEDTSPHLSILESLGGGVALLDYDRDGFLDVYVPGGGHFGGADKKTILGHPGKLYRNPGTWVFADVTEPVGLGTLGGGQPWFYSHGAAAADYDRDGWPDLLVTGWKRLALFRNEPDGNGGRRFADVSAKAGLATGVDWTTSAAWADFDGDGHPDLYACQYVDWSFSNHPDCNYDGKTPDVCPPKKFKGLVHKVYRNRGDGTFEDVSAAVGLAPGGEHASKGLGVVVADVNLDGKPDMYVANDTVPNFLYVNQSVPGKVAFKEQGKLSFVALDGTGGSNGSMGLDAGDPTGSGLPDLWVTNYENELHALYRNVSKGDRVHFLYHTPASGIAAIGQKFVGWGTAFVDLDHHGWEDLVVVNGHAIRYPATADRRQKPVILRNKGGKFKDVTVRGGPFFREPHLSRGLAAGDLDNDGMIDLVVVQMNEPVAVLRNVAPTAGNHWVGFALERPGHADVVGARVVVEAGGRKQTRFAKGGGSYASTPDRRLVVGLGTADRIDKVTVHWPDGQVQEWAGVAADRYHVLVQGQKEPQPPKK